MVPHANPAEGMANTEASGGAGAVQTGLKLLLSSGEGSRAPWEAVGILTLPRGARMSSSAGSVGGRAAGQDPGWAPTLKCPGWAATSLDRGSDY